MARLLSSTALVLGVFTLAVTPALAKGNGGGGGGNGGSSSGSSAWVSVSPNPAAAGGTRVYLSGCGYSFALAQVVVTHPAGSITFSVPMWVTGCMDGGSFYTAEAGTYTVNVYQASSTKRNATMVLKASTTLTVT